MTPLVVLFLLTLANEVAVVAYTLAIAKQKPLLTAIVSAIIEPLRLAAIFYAIDSTNRPGAVLVVSVACAVGSGFTIWLAKSK